MYNMKFEIGKYYQHSSGGEVIHILAKVNTFFYGETLLAETNSGDLNPVGCDECNAENYLQVSGWPRSTYTGNGIHVMWPQCSSDPVEGRKSEPKCDPV